MFPKECLIRNEALMNLGLALIELCFGRTLSQMKEKQDLGPNPQMTRLNTALRLQDEVYDEIGVITAMSYCVASTAFLTCGRRVSRMTFSSRLSSIKS